MKSGLEEIIKGCKSGNIKAQEKLYKLYAEELFGVCLYYSKDYTEAEDILHDGFLKIFKNIDTYRYKGSFEGWMRRIMINTALEKFRREKHLHPVTEPEESRIDIPSDDMTSRINARELVALIQKLSPKYRMVFNLYAIEGYSHREISQMLGITTGTSKSNLARARMILQKNVKKYYFNDTRKVNLGNE